MTATLITKFPTLPAVADSLSAYISAVGKLPVLSADEEKALAIALRDNNDTEAARRLILGNLHLVISVSRGYSGYGLNQSDLIQEGNIGLMKAVRKFDVTRGVRLATFAVYWIKAEMHEFIIRNWRIVKIATTKAQRKLFFNKNRLDKSVHSDDNETIARELNVKPEEVGDMRARLYQTNTAALSTDSEDDAPGAEAYLADESAGAGAEEQLEQKFREQVLTEAVAALNEREGAILKARRFAEPPATLKQLAAKYNISMERVRQIEAAAFDKVAHTVRSRLDPVSA